MMVVRHVQIIFNETFETLAAADKTFFFFAALSLRTHAQYCMLHA